MDFKKLIPDSIYLRIMYKKTIGERLHLSHPITFNEKLQWLKLHDRNPLYTRLVDKYEVKDYISVTLGKKYVIPAYGVWESFDEIPFDQLPNRFVLKCTHDSGGLVVCHNKEVFDKKKAREKISASLQNNYYWIGREWPYKMVRPRVLAEKYVEDSNRTGELTDYKIHCFNGEPKLIQVISGRFSNGAPVNDHYTLDWEKLTLSREHFTTSKNAIPKPNGIDEMLELAKKISKGIYYVRVDFYIVEGQVYFGEITFFPSSGFKSFDPKEWDLVLGKWLKIPTDFR